MARYDGDAGDNTHTGTGNNDVLNGLGGNDTLNGAGGNDTVNGGDGDDVLSGNDGQDTLNGQAGADQLFGGADDDELRGGDGDDDLEGGDGDDYIRGEAGHDVLIGGLGNDLLVAGDGNNSADGGAGNDTLYGGAGSDMLVGGDGDDTFWGTYLTLNPGDTVDGGAGYDMLALSSSVDLSAVTLTSVEHLFIGYMYAQVTLAAEQLAGLRQIETGSYVSLTLGTAGDATMQAGAVIDYQIEAINLSAGGNTLDLRGVEWGGVVNGGAAADTVFGATYGTVLYGNGGDDTLTGGVAFNRLDGGAGNDTLTGGISGDELTGGEGLDMLNGGGGDDQIFVNAVSEIVAGERYAGGTGVDRLTFYVTEHVDITAMKLLGVEEVVQGHGAALTLSTTQLGSLSYLYAGSVTLGTRGTAVIDAGADIQVLNAINLHARGNTLDMSASSWSGVVNGGGRSDTVLGGSGAVELFGNGGNDILSGGDAMYDMLHGGAGSDTLGGGAGDDWLTGGTGLDMMSGGDGFDTFFIAAQNELVAGEVYDGGAGTDQVFLDLSGSIDLSALTLVGIEEVYAAYDVALSMTAAQLAGMSNVRATSLHLTTAGTIALTAGVSLPNLIYLNAGGNRLDLRNAGGANPYGGGAYDVMGGSAADTVIGGAAGVNAYGYGGDDVLTGGVGNDRLTGGTGLDRQSGGAGDDTFFIDAANEMVAGERYVGGDGIDELSLQFDGHADLSAIALLDIERIVQRSGNELSLKTGQLGALSFLNATEVTITNRGTVTLQPGASFFVSELNLSDLGNTLDLTGTNFGSTVNGGTAADRVTAGLGPAMFRGNGGNDTLTGGAQNDILDGGTGNDRMIGGLGDDDFYVDSANDIVTEAAGGGIDAVLTTVSYSLAAAAEVEILATATYLSTTPIRLTGNGFSNTILANIGNNVLVGGGGADILVGGAGRDTLTGGAADDYFYFADGDLNATRATADTITDFNRAAGDVIVLEDIDARETAAGDQAFTFIGSSSFSGIAGQLRYDKQGGNTYIEGDTDGNRVADFVICLTGSITLLASDFFL